MKPFLYPRNIPNISGQIGCNYRICFTNPFWMTLTVLVFGISWEYKHYPVWDSFDSIRNRGRSALYFLCVFLLLAPGICATGRCSFFCLGVLRLLSVPCGSPSSGLRIPAFATGIPPNDVLEAVFPYVVSIIRVKRNRLTNILEMVDIILDNPTFFRYTDFVIADARARREGWGIFPGEPA